MGAFYGYSALINEVKNYFPQVTPLNLKDFNISRVKQKGGDLSTFIDNKNSFIKEEDIRLTPNFTLKSTLMRPQPMTWLGSDNKKNTTAIKDSNLPKEIIIRDSFTTSMMPYLSESFSKLTYEQEWQYSLNKQFIDEDRPDVVIFEVVERNINKLLDN
ncbi:hypothetical protein IAI10_22195 [Clostridium sp. 19966]|uniref:hypothetical protein n=1 Tax=Clostridium sp. 19966 TaxID=2768166 RepID=UPI0028DF428D|nr:hypothetical protein [Clostridium sp. 19966]MDT8719368.1 hypothetical protein [Clostridium sp. 19966]